MIARRSDEVAMLREGGRRLRSITTALARAVRPGVTTLDLDERAERFVREAGGTPVFKGYRPRGSERPFPATICTSINDEVVHGIPRRDRILHGGDIIGLDIGMRWPARDGLVTDMAVTVPVGKVSPMLEELIQVTAEALELGIRSIRAEGTTGDIGHAIQEHIEVNGFSVVRELVGHGVGKRLHEDPYVPNFGNRGEGERLVPGMVLAIEPMATTGSAVVVLGRDGWTWRTRDGSFAAHFEHTIIITERDAEVLTR